MKTTNKPKTRFADLKIGDWFEYNRRFFEKRDIHGGAWLLDGERKIRQAHVQFRHNQSLLKVG